MPELLEEPIADVNGQVAQVADTDESSDSAVAEETNAEPAIES